MLAGSRDHRHGSGSRHRITLGRPFQHQCRVRCVAFSPDGKTVVTGGDGEWLWDSATGRPLGQPLQHEGSVDSVRYSRDGKGTLTFERRGTDAIRLWDAATGQPIGEPLLHQGSVMSLAVGADGKTVVVLGGDRPPPRLWDVPPVGRSESPSCNHWLTK